MGLDLNSIFNNLVSDVIWVTLVGLSLLMLRHAKKLARPHVVSFRVQIFLSLALTHGAILFWMMFRFSGLPNWEKAAVPLVVAAMNALFIWWTLRGFQTAQIIAAFPTTKDGVNYADSLKLVNKSFDFMGIGAAKLTDESEFSNALDRCADLTAPGPTVRLLLARPDHTIISRAARANSTADIEYQRNVTDSLKKIARIAERTGGSVKVRHYNDDLVKEYPQFRLMFIDNEFCLFSWNVWDSTKGKNNPQLILRRGNARNESRALYKSYKKYFNDLWEVSDDVDLSAYL